MSVHLINKYYNEVERTIRYADYKEKVIDLLQRDCTMSVETVRIVGEMEGRE